MIRLPNVPPQIPTNGNRSTAQQSQWARAAQGLQGSGTEREDQRGIQQAMEDQRQLNMWRETLYRMFNMGGTTTPTVPLLAAGDSTTFTIQVIGCKPDMAQTVILGPPSAIEAGLYWWGIITANDVVTVRLVNGGLVPVTPAQLEWAARVIP